MQESLKYIIILLLLILPVTGQSQDTTSGSAIKISEIGKKHLGITVEEAIQKFNLDTAKAFFQEEPPMIIRGIRTELNDSTILYLQIKSTYYENRDFNFKKILNEKVTGIALAFSNCREKHWGTGFIWWGIQNPLCKNPPFDQKWYRKQEGMQ